MAAVDKLTAAQVLARRLVHKVAYGEAYRETQSQCHWPTEATFWKASRMVDTLTEDEMAMLCLATEPLPVELWLRLLDETEADDDEREAVAAAVGFDDEWVGIRVPNAMGLDKTEAYLNDLEERAERIRPHQLKKTIERLQAVLDRKG